MVVFEITALNAAKPIVIAGVGTLLLERSGFDLSQLPLVGGFIGDSTGDGDEEAPLTARYFCCFGRRRKTKIKDDEEPVSGISNCVPTALRALTAIDIIMGGILLESMYLPIDQPLRKWLAGALTLGLPTSFLISNVAEKVGFRQAFIVESIATVVSSAWLSYGMMIVSKSTAYKSAPLLFWTVYIACVTTWSVIGTSMLGLILTTVVAILFGKKRALN
ncbi:unnamed protein product [Amoebophrya sp. A25]|nr:unnamed protein product [Amoebophrya sp. A25]|eukprot:GSA25T00005730001.1